MMLDCQGGMQVVEVSSCAAGMCAVACCSLTNLLAF